MKRIRKPTTNRVLARNVAAVLNGAQTRALDFSYRDVAVNTAAFQRVIQHLLRETILVLDAPPPELKLPRAATAMYLAALNVMILPRNMNLLDVVNRSLVVHEAVHAVQDAQAAAISLEEAEVMGWCAQLAYLGGGTSPRPRGTSPIDRFLRAVADLVDRHGIGRRHAALPQTEVARAATLYRAVLGAAVAGQGHVRLQVTDGPRVFDGLPRGPALSVPLPVPNELQLHTDACWTDSGQTRCGRMPYTVGLK